MIRDLSPESIMNSPEKAELVAAIEEAKAKHDHTGIDHTGKIVCSRNRIDQELIDEAYRLIAAADERRANAAVGRLTFCLVSRDHGRIWTKHALCDECIKGQEPPVRVRREGSTGSEPLRLVRNLQQEFLREEG